MASWVKYQCVNGGRSRNDGQYYWFVNTGFFQVLPTVCVAVTIGHLLFVYSLYLMYVEKASYTFIWTNCMLLFVAFGISCGAHLLWSHRCYEATWPLRVALMMAQTVSGQFDLYHWCRDHRTHHKWSDTDADPHNPTRGFLFAHIGWIMKRKHPEMRIRSMTLDYSDLMKDPIVRYYGPLFFVFGLLLPTAIPVWLWNESWLTSFLSSFVTRLIVSMHGTLLINSAAHMWGDKPYNGNIAPTDNGWVSAITFGAGYHNYHHMFPSDYASSEPDRRYNLARDAIDLMAKLGLAYNLKTTSAVVIRKTKEKADRERTKFYGLKASPSCHF